MSLSKMGLLNCDCSSFQVNNNLKGVLKFTPEEFKKIDLGSALQYALAMPEIDKFKQYLLMEKSDYIYYSNCHGILSLFTAQKHVEKTVEQK